MQCSVISRSTATTPAHFHFRWPCNLRARRAASCTLVRRRRRLGKLCAFEPDHDTAANSLQLPEGEYGMPLLGESLEWIRDMPTFFNSRYEKYGSTFKTHLFGNKTVVISDPMQICRILQAEDKLAELAMPEGFQKLLPNSLFSVTSDEHRATRRLLAPAFAESSLKMYHPVVVEVVDKTLKQCLGQPSVNAYTVCRTLAFDVAASVLLGVKWDGDTLNELRGDFTVFVQGAFSLLPLDLPGTRYRKAKDRQAKINQVVDGVIQQTRLVLALKQKDNLEAGKQLRKRRQVTALEVMLEARDDQGNPLSDKMLHDQVIGQMFAGHETTASALTRLLQYVKGSPQVLTLLRAEQDQLADQYGSQLTAEMVEKMPVVDACIKEVLRLHDPATLVFRKALQDIQVEDKVIPKGWSMQLHLDKAQHNVTEFLGDHNDFRPQRFLDANNQLLKREPAGYTPWGAGPRKCMGIPLATSELRVFLALLARDYEWTCDPQEPWITADNFRPKDKLPTKFSSRH